MSSCFNIILNGDRTLDGISLSALDGQTPLSIPDNACLRFLSIVETTRIPLYLSIGSPWTVSTSSADTEHWFHDIFLHTTLDRNGPSQSQWWETPTRDSPLGVVVAVPDSHDGVHQSKPRVTELLFYASQHNNVQNRFENRYHSSPSLEDTCANGKAYQGTLTVHAIALSSDLLQQAWNTEPTPPVSPVARGVEIDGLFLPQTFPGDVHIINEPPVRKRKSATDAFDQASERRKKARRKGGEGVSAAAAMKTDTQTAATRHGRSGSDSLPLQPQVRSLSRSPSVSSSRAPTAIPVAARLSTLSRVHSVTSIPDAPDIETKNKDLISRITMAGMRFYGLSQSKSRKPRASSSVSSPAVDLSFEEVETERKNDEEFKLIYHQAFKGTCFVFRGSIAERSLQASPEAIRDVADKLLAIYCGDPLKDDVEQVIMSKVTDVKPEAFVASIQ